MTSRGLQPRSLFFALLALAACQLDPAHDDAVNALGGEAQGVRAGPLHRPGQPCLTCHTSKGPAPDFAVAGTVFDVRGSTTGLQGVTVTMTDAAGEVRRVNTNSAGNFYLQASEWNPAFPMHVQLDYPGEKTKPMDTRIGRNGGCGECHQGQGSTTKMPGVYLREP